MQGLPGSSSQSPSGGISLPPGFPSLAELEAMEGDEVNEVLGLRPKFDIPAAARRSVAQVGLLSYAEGGFPVRSLAGQPAALVRAALEASNGPVISRWGHILLRRALASRLDAPEGMDPVLFAALRVRALGAMGEGAVARALAQDIDGSNYDRALTDAAFDAYVATGDILGMCPVARLQSDLRENAEWELVQGICSAYLGETRGANRRLERALGTGLASEIDVRLAQRFAGAAGEGSRAVNVEWAGVEELTPWRHSLARVVGAEVPEDLRSSASSSFDLSEVLIPATPLDARIASADLAGARGLLSASAMVDLYSQLWESDAYSRDDKTNAGLLRAAYVAGSAAERLSAMRQLWGDGADYGRLVLTSYAAARLPVSQDLVADVAPLIASMLAAGLDRNALRWAGIVPEGSEAWAMLALADASGNTVGVDVGAVEDFLDEDTSSERRKSAFLIAGLAGLGKLESDDTADLANELGVNLTRSTAWSSKISRAAQVENRPLVSLLAGLGMQGSSWEQMTPRHLYHVVSALNRVGLSAEARMIAAEAVARG